MEARISPNVARLIRMVISALIAGCMAGGGVILLELQEKGELGTAAIAIASVMGGLATLKDIQAYLAQPPSGPGL